MPIRRLLVALLLCMSIPAVADIVATTTKAHEVEVADLRLPGSTSGTLSFKACDDCPYQTVRVTSATRYLGNDRNFTLEEFRTELERIENPHDRHVTVLHDLESNTITAVRASL